MKISFRFLCYASTDSKYMEPIADCFDDEDRPVKAEQYDLREILFPNTFQPFGLPHKKHVLHYCYHTILLNFS